MLYPYPLSATTDNWIHDCVIEALKTIHRLADASAPIPAWPGVLPATCRSPLRRRTGLRDKLKAYHDALVSLDEQERARVEDAIDQQNRIAELLACACDCALLEELPTILHEPVAALFEYAFELLSELGVRDQHYRAVFDSAEHHVCPFCGYERFSAPGSPREDLDHFLPRSKYPFAGANLRNLVPMGSRCNSRYKLAVDVLRNGTGRRQVLDPYGTRVVRVSLNGSEPFAGTDGRLPRWKVDIEPASPEADSWDEIFSIRDRYRDDILDQDFERWLRDLRRLCRGFNAPTATPEDVIQALDRAARAYEAMGLSDTAFLKAEVFRMLRDRCVDGDDRLLDFLLLVLA